MKATIYLDSDSLPKVEFQHGGVKRVVSVTMHDLMNSIFNAFEDVETDEPVVHIREEALLISTALPLNTVKHGIYSEGTQMIALAYPATQHNVQYHTTEFKEVGFPNLLFVFKLKENRLIEKSVYCYKDNFVRDDTQLYAYPYANVFDGGSMCFYLPGDHSIQDLVQLQTLPHIWRSTIMNDHLYNSKRTTLNLALRQLLDNFQNKPFDHDILDIPVKTFGQIT